MSIIYHKSLYVGIILRVTKLSFHKKRGYIMLVYMYWGHHGDIALIYVCEVRAENRL
jgi:hypothetical protein